ncbi:hypothetical protein H8E50_10720 [bacterium]|nr:hypothetical protein [bacterium]
MKSGRAATLLTVVQVLRALDKLDVLDLFQEQAEVSPLQLLKMHEKKRRRASGFKEKPGVSGESTEW